MTTSAVPIDKKMPTVAYYSDEDTETYTNLLFTELVHEQLVADRGEEEIENDPSLEFLFVSPIAFNFHLTRPFDSLQDLAHQRLADEATGQRFTYHFGGLCQKH